MNTCASSPPTYRPVNYHSLTEGQCNSQFPPSPPLSTIEVDGQYSCGLVGFSDAVHPQHAYASPALSATSIDESIRALSTSIHFQPYETQSTWSYDGPSLSPDPPNPRSASPSPPTAAVPTAPSRHQRASLKRSRPRRPAARRSKHVVCSWPGCSKPYTREQDLNRHVTSVSLSLNQEIEGSGRASIHPSSCPKAKASIH